MEVSGSTRSHEIPLKRPKVCKIPDTRTVTPEPTPPVFNRKLRKAAVGTGCDIRLRVSVAGHPKPVLTWYHNEEAVPPSEAQDPGGLWIRDCRTSDAGLYTCVATNDLGEASCSAVLAVMDLGEDSEATEDETTEPQVETKEGAGRHQEKAGPGGPSGDGGKLINSNHDSSDRRATLPGTHDPVVERELRTLGSRPPGTYMDPTNLARQALGGGPAMKGTPPVRHLGVEPLIRASHANLARPVQGSEESVSVGSDYYGSMTQTVEQSFQQESTSRVPLSSPEPPLSMCNPYRELQKPKPSKADQSKLGSISTPSQRLVHGGPKISDKVRAYEERKGCTEPLKASSLRKAASLDSGESGQKTGGPSKQDERILQGAAQKRATFKQRASSLEDKISYSQRVQTYQSKFTEELQRIKKMVGKPSLKKAHSTEQLSHNERIPLKVEPIPSQVVKKLEARERALEEGSGGGSRQQVPPKLKDKEFVATAKPNLHEKPLDTFSGGLSGGISVAMDTAPVHQLPGQPVPTVTRTNLTRDERQISAASNKDLLATLSSSSINSSKDQRTRSKGESDMKVGTRSLSPTGKLETPGPPKPPRLNSSPTQSVSPLLKRRKAEVGKTISPSVRVNIPTILVEDEPVKTEGRTKRREGKVRKSKNSAQSTSPTGGASSDDSYQSADEDSVEAPRFKRPLQATAAAIGSEVTLKCVIMGNPPPTVTWRKDDMEISPDAGHVLKASGEDHSLVIKQMSLNDVGSYGVTAVSAAGRAFCSTALNVQPEWTQHGKPALSLEISSPIQSDEEYLSPQEEAMEIMESPTALTSLREVPSFEVMPADQDVSEGEDIVVSVKVKGQPKPLTYWSKDGVRIKTTGRFTVRETHEGTEELRISPGQTSDSGYYMCKIINEYGNKQAECRVKVTAQTSLKITREVNDVSARAGESAMFECHVIGPSDVDVDWLSNGKLIQPALLNCKMHFDGKRCRLLLNSVHEDDSGTYTCKLSTAREELTSSANLKVTPSKEPLFTRKLDILEVIEGRTARFNCKVSGSPPPQVTWMHFETRVEENDNVHILQEGGRHSLVINHVSSDTEGFYTAIAQNIYGKSECTAELYVQESRAAISSHMAKLEKMPSIPEEPEGMESEVEKRTMPDFVTPLADIEVIEGKEAVLECKVAGLPYPTIAWYHNGKRIESSEEFKNTQYGDVHHLVIRTTCHSHGGVYKAVISNKVGKATCYAHLYVTDIVPDAPDGPPVIDAITGKTISLSWKKPKKTEPSFDTSALLYVVQQQPLGSTQWTVIATNLKETNYTVSSLSKGVRYAFRVLTSTGKTQSRPSPSTDLVQLLDRGPYLRKAPVFIDKPDTVYVIENQPASITVTLNHVQAVVTWKRRGVALANKPGTYEMSMPDDDQHTLKLQRVKSLDLGQLVVMASNQFGSDLCTLQLTMAVPPKFETIMEDVDVQVGDTSRLAVVVEGKPDPDILWYKDDLLLCESSHFTFVYDDPEYSLVILNARPEHSGVYTCTAKNLAGSNSCKAELTIHTEKKKEMEPMEDEGTILRKMRRLTDYYDVHKEIGRGAFSCVKRVTEKKTKAEFAAKFISARGRRKVLALREMDLLSELDHEKILYFHDAFEKKYVMVIITELCHEEFLERIAKRTTVMELEIRSTVQQVLEGLEYLHQKNIVHLDIKPENILMLRPGSDQIRICDYGNAIKLESSDEYYCKYGTPEFIAPEIVNQTPVSTATDIWPVGVITYLCLTGVSPFAGENDRVTALNIRNYNVAFEESMFADLCKEARGFVIKLMVVDRLRPSATECLRHPWFKSLKNKTISTGMLKQVLFRRKWQRSLISYKAKMVMRSIPELLNESSNHVSIAVSRHLKEGSEQLSSSSDSDADVDELPFIPMPLSMVFSGSRVSLNEISGEGAVAAWHRADGTGNKENVEVGRSRGGKPERLADEDETTSGQKMVERKVVPLKKGASVEAEELENWKARRATMRRGSSADSALLHVDTEEEKSNEETENSSKNLKKSLSMELPNRSPSPGAAKLSQEDYALKLELMRQRLLRGGSMDKKMSGLRGPLFETLGIDDQSQTGSLDRNLRRSRAGPSTIIRAASTDTPSDDTPKTKVFKKSVSFTQGDSEPMPLHRRFGEPLQIPSTGSCNNEGKKLKEATSMSALTEQTALESTSSSPNRKPSIMLPKEEEDQKLKQNNMREHGDTARTSRTKSKSDQTDSVESLSSPGIPSIRVVVENDEAPSRKKDQELDILENNTNENEIIAQPSDTIQPAVLVQTTDSLASSPPDGTVTAQPPALSEHPAVFAKVATADQSPTTVSSSLNPKVSVSPRQVMLRTDIKDIDSEEVFEARFKKRESSLTRGIRKLTRNKSDDKSPVLSRKSNERGEEIYRPGPRGAPIEMVASGLQAKSKSVQDLREEDKETALSRIGRFSLRNKRSTTMDKKVEKAEEEKAQGVLESAVRKRVSWAVGRSKSLDTNEQRPEENRELRKEEESSVSAMRRRFESKVAGISAKLRSQSEERNNKGAEEGQKELVQRKEVKKATDSPILAMRQRFENKVSEISTIIRSQSEERKGETEGKRTPLFTRHRHSQSEGRGAQAMGIPENQLAQQAGTSVSRESNESVSSFQSDKGSDSDRRSRWDRWGLTRGKKDKTSSQTDLPSSPTKKGDMFVRTASDFAPVFHIKLKDQILLEWESVTLTCLPAGSPHPEITWMKDRKPLELNDRINLVSHPDGRQLLSVMKCSRRETGIYECVATNPIATVTTSCTLSIACVPKRPGTPEVPQTYDTTALVLWKPSDTKPPCSYTLERKKEGDLKWLTVATGVVDCYYNVTNLPQGDTFRFRVSCVNRAGQGPHSNQSAPVCMNSTGDSVSAAVTAVKTVPTIPVVTSSVILPAKPVQSNSSRTITSTSSAPRDPSSITLAQPIPSSSHPSPPPAIPTAAPVGSKTKKTIKVPSLPSSPTVKPPPPFVLPKPQSPVNIVTPMTQTTPVSAPPPHLVAVDQTKPAVPTATVTARVAPTPVSPTPTTPTAVSQSSLASPPVTPSPVTFSPQVLQMSSLSPIGESVRTSSRGTPSGHSTPSTVLRQGVPQKPYTFLEEKARGRFGVIRECRENSTGKIFMAKIIPYSQENKSVILKEYEILKSLHNDKVLSLHEAYVTPRYLVLVSEYCTGKELLYSLIERFRYSEDDVVGYLVQLLQGVEYLHSRRVLHLDLKPDNIMVTNLNTIKIVDLGSAQSFNPLSLKQQDSRRGTLEYMAPEMVKGEVLGPPSDVWTVGVVTFIMLSGRLPFEDKDPLKVESKILMAKFEPAKLYPNVSQSASAFLKKMLSSYPWARATTRDCFAHAWLQDSYLMKLRRQTLTFTSNRLKEFLVEQQSRRTADATKHKVLLRTYQSSHQSPARGTPGPADVK